VLYVITGGSPNRPVDPRVDGYSSRDDADCREVCRRLPPRGRR